MLLPIFKQSDHKSTKQPSKRPNGSIIGDAIFESSAKGINIPPFFNKDKYSKDEYADQFAQENLLQCRCLAYTKQTTITGKGPTDSKSKADSKNEERPNNTEKASALSSEYDKGGYIKPVNFSNAISPSSHVSRLPSRKENSAESRKSYSKTKVLSDGKSIQGIICRLLENSTEEKKYQKDSIALNNLHYHALSDVVKNAKLLLVKDENSTKFLIKRKRSEVKDLLGYSELNLQAKKIELLPKEHRRKEYVQTTVPSEVKHKRHHKSKLLKRSFSPIIERNENASIKEHTNFNNVYKKRNHNNDSLDIIKKRTRMINIDRCNTGSGSKDENEMPEAEPNPQHFSSKLLIKTFRKGSQIKSSTPISKLKGKVDSENKMENEQPQLKNINTSNRPKRILRKEIKKIEEEPVPIQKKPPVPRFSFLVRVPKEKVEEKIVEEKVKPKPKPMPVFQSNDSYLVHH